MRVRNRCLRGISLLLFSVVLCFRLGTLSAWSQDLRPVVPVPEKTPPRPSKIIRHSPAPATPLDEARQLYWNDDYKRAAALYSNIIAAGTDVAEAYAGLALVYLRMKKEDVAYNAAAKAVELEPSLAAAHAALGEVYFRQAKLFEAEQEFLTPLRAEEEDARAYFGLSHIYHATFNEKRAKWALDRAHALDPKDPEINGDWLQTRPAAEQIRALESFVASGGRGGHIVRSRARQMLAILNDQAQHPDHTCRLVSKVRATEMDLAPLFSFRGVYRKTQTDQSTLNRFYPGVGLDVRLNRSTARLIIETSGDRIVLNQHAAKEAGARQLVRTEIEGAGDENPPEGYTAYVQSIKIGEIEFEACYVTVIEEASPRNSLATFEGSIGAGIFSNFLVDLDLRHSKLRLTELPPYPEGTTENATPEENGTIPGQFHDRYVAAEMADWTPLYRSDRLLLLPTYTNGSMAKLFGISLGSNINAISPEAAQEVSTIATDQFAHVRGLNGEVTKARRTGAIKLQFAGMEFDADALPVVDMSVYSENGLKVSGLLGFPALRTLDTKIDYRDGLIRFDDR